MLICKKLLNHSGLSLLEILIAMTLLAFVMFGVISVTTDSTETKDRIVAEDREYMSVETAFTRMDWDFSHIYSPLFFGQRFVIKDNEQEKYLNLIERLQVNKQFTAIDEDGRPIPLFENPESYTFEFFTASNRRKFEDQRQSNFAWVRYTLIDEDRDDSSINSEQSGSKALVRYYNANDPYSIDRLIIDEIKPQVLLNNVEELKFSFWDINKKDFVSSLDQVVDGFSKIYGIKVEVIIKDSLGVKRTLTRVFRSLFPYRAEDPPDVLKAIEAAKNGTQTGDNQVPAGSDGDEQGEDDEGEPID